ncbi:histidine kinase dimerization/phospho-acceptor domain-containing protein [Variovorax sp. J22P271]|uniref:histidine kinase dimerization/phospho-acceptor domain-containing protein n=1 Tax=Variovorax davisae TaxID=3053515 RepID=UPI002576FCA9|nr:histidine kinase dimerization/phospho-acceptor domain-containing protein [Variovorax sp. J22P271]MDM0032181.1 histidine kinase dimerization/phospho-acceptor domain-containing protein [Variovorax sp. J22P271]
MPQRPSAYSWVRRLAVAAGTVVAVKAVLQLRRRTVTRQASLQRQQREWSDRAIRLEHDLRTPVGAIAMALELLQTSGEVAVRAQAVEVLQRQVARMTSLTEDARELARAIGKNLP